MVDVRRKILFMIPSLGSGGAERVIITLLRNLDRSKFILLLTVLNLRNAVFRNDVPDDVKLIDLQCSRVRYALPKIIKTIWEQKPDVVFSTLGHLNLALAIARPVLPNSIYYLARESSIISEVIHQTRMPGLWRRAYRRFYSRFDNVICQSRFMQNDLMANYAFPENRSVVIHNPVDVKRVRGLAAKPIATGFDQSTNKTCAVINLVAAGRLSHEKGFDILIEALAICNNPHLYLTLLGDGSLLNELKLLCLNKGLNRQIRFAGFQKNPYPFFARADAFVVSSRFEGFPNVVLEALACGTPVIATPAIGGIREILDIISGCVVAQGLTASDLACAIQHWINSDKRRIESDAISPFSIDNIIRNYESVLLNTDKNAFYNIKN